MAQDAILPFRSSPRRSSIGFCLLVLTALTLRLTVVWALGAPQGAPVTFEHGEIAENLLAGRGFSVHFLGASGPTSQQAPLYPAMLATIYALFGTGSAAAILALKLLQCAAGTCLVVCVAWLGWSLIPQRPLVGWVAGWGAAIYPTHLYMVTHVQVALWAALFLTLLLALVASKQPAGAWRRAVLVGLVGGLLLLWEPILALALPAVCLLFWRVEARAPARTKRLATAAAVAAAVVAPWLLRNYLVHGEPVFIKSTFGYAFWQGNNPASWGTDKIPKHAAEAMRRAHDGSLAGIDRALWEARHETLYIDDVLLAPTGYRELAGLNEPGRCRLLGLQAWRFVRQDPPRYARLCARRLRYFLLFDDTNPKAANRLYRIATVTWLVMSFVGLLALRPHWRALGPSILIFAAVTLFHSLTIVSARFRIPIEPLSFVWAAGAVVPSIERVASWTHGSRTAPTLALPAVLPASHDALQKKNAA